MRTLVVLTYYRPHISGLTIYAERLARALVKRGHQVTVLTSHYDKNLPLDEIQDGVRVIRVPVMFRLSKGVVMPTFGLVASRLVREHDVIHLHLPQFDAAGIALRGRLFKKPTVITYHCDLRMPPGLVAWFANQAVRVMNNLAAVSTHRVVTYTQDYGENSPFLRRYLKKLKVISPPVELAPASTGKVAEFQHEHNPANHRPVIAMVSRFATEKGVEVLLDSLPQLLQDYPDLLVQFAGAYQNIMGEEHYFSRLKPLIQKYQQEGHWQFLGPLNPSQLAAFYPNIDVLVVPSLNSTESFGLVQIEAMMNSIPCVASNLPGVRQPVKMHHMGEIIEIGDARGLAVAVKKILKNKQAYIQDPAPIAQKYLPDTVAVEYENLFSEIQKEIND